MLVSPYPLHGLDGTTKSLRLSLERLLNALRLEYVVLSFRSCTYYTLFPLGCIHQITY
jgi:hypothetical protein